MGGKKSVQCKHTAGHEGPHAASEFEMFGDLMWTAPVSTEDTDLRAQLCEELGSITPPGHDIPPPWSGLYVDAALSVVRPLLDAKEAENAGLRKDLYWSNNTLATRTRQQEDWAAAEHEARRERDEARAEIEQLNKQIATIKAHYQRRCETLTVARNRLRAEMRDLATHAYKCGLVDTVGDDIDPTDTVGNALDAGQVALTKVAQLQQEREERAARDLAAAPVSSVEPEQATCAAVVTQWAGYGEHGEDECGGPLPCPVHGDFPATEEPAVPEQAQPRDGSRVRLKETGSEGTLIRWADRWYLSQPSQDVEVELSDVEVVEAPAGQDGA